MCFDSGSIPSEFGSLTDISRKYLHSNNLNGIVDNINNVNSNMFDLFPAGKSFINSFYVRVVSEFV